MNPQAFVIDVDGVLTTGAMLYSSEGKAFKIFGPDDHDALEELRPHLPIHCISADHRGFAITKARVQQDMGLPLTLVSTPERLDWLRSRWELKRIIYMGDGFHDDVIFSNVGYSIAPANAFFRTRNLANHVTSHRGGDRAVAEAVLHIKEKFFSAR